jgi:hypothetical protein
MFKKGMNPFAKGGKEEGRDGGKRKKTKRKSKRMMMGRK